MKKVLLLFFCLTSLLLAAGCGGMKWKHDYKPQSEMRADYEECQRDVRNWRWGFSGRDDAFTEQVLVNECMENKGWYR